MTDQELIESLSDEVDELVRTIDLLEDQNEKMLETLKTASLALDHAGVWGTRDVINLVITLVEKER